MNTIGTSDCTVSTERNIVLLTVENYRKITVFVRSVEKYSSQMDNHDDSDNGDKKMC